MSEFTKATWMAFIDDLQESREKHTCSTRDPIWMVQEKQKTWGMHPDYSDKSKWIIGGEAEYKTAQELFDDQDAAVRHEVNGFSLKDRGVLFDDLNGDESSQDELLKNFASEFNYDWSKIYYSEDWVSIHVFATHHDADRFIKSQGHNYKELRVYVESMWRSPQLCDLMQAILDGDLKFIKEDGI